MIEFNFDIGSVEYTEFGVGRDDMELQEFHVVRLGPQAQDALREMVVATRDDMEKSVAGSPTQMEFLEVYNGTDANRSVAVQDPEAMQKKLDGGPQLYSPSEKYAGTEYLYVPLTDNMVSSLRDFHKAANLPVDSRLLDDSDSVFCYFARMTDNDGRRVTAIRRAIGFKGVLKKKLLGPITGDALDLIDSRIFKLDSDFDILIDSRIFKLDSDFDILIDSEYVHIWRPNSFESVGRLKEDILNAVSTNVASIEQDIDFVDFTEISKYAATHVMAARYLASIRVQAAAGPISKEALLRLCEYTGVDVEEKSGTILIDGTNVMGFLEVLDRRRYGVELVEGQREQFRATSRQRIDRTR